MPKETLIRGLNEDLSAELGTIARNLYQASQAFGPVGAEIRRFLLEALSDELRHAALLMDIITDLGGEPTTTAEEFNKLERLDAVLEMDLGIEMQGVENYKRRAQQAAELGHIELKIRLEEMAADEARHARELRRLLKGMK